MAYVPFVQEIAAVYTLTAPSGAVAVFNNASSPNYAGMLSEVTGLDSAEVRESASELSEADGGTHGNFYFGRRPITMTVKVFGHSTSFERAERIDRLHRAALAMRGDSMLTWAPTYASSTGMQLPVRLNQPIRDTGAWAKEIQLALVSAQAVIESQTLNQSAAIASGGSALLENKGSYTAFPTLRISGVSSNPQVTGGGGTLHTGPTGYTLTLASDETVEINCLTHQAKFIAGPRNGQSANRYIHFAATLVWPHLDSGNNTFALTGGGSLTVLWRDAWH